MRQLLALILALVCATAARAETRTITLEQSDDIYNGLFFPLPTPDPGKLFVRVDFDPALSLSLPDFTYLTWWGQMEYLIYNENGNEPPYDHNSIQADINCLTDSCLKLTAPGRLEAVLDFPENFYGPGCPDSYCLKLYHYEPGFLSLRLGGLSVGPSTATLTLSSTPIGAIPEPATWAMLIVGFGLTGTLLRRSRRLAAA